ncbi:MAG: NAD(P)/FAD-dependent oxidoreductase, partial [Pannonibacter indicus]
MTQQPSPAILQGAPDVLVIGAGVFGLSTARAAAEAGLSVTLVEADQVGSGASGGVLGALMPHMPARWNAKKAFQFEALAGLEGHIARLEAETGLETGYRRCGRVLPITTADLLAHHHAREGAQQVDGGVESAQVVRDGGRAQRLQRRVVGAQRALHRCHVGR